jgi:TonB family protein
VFDTLLASDARSDHPALPAASAVGVHLLLLGAAVAVSRADVPAAVPQTPLAAVYFLPAAATSGTSATPQQASSIPAAPSTLPVAAPTDPGLPVTVPGIGTALGLPGGLPGVGMPGSRDSTTSVLSLQPLTEGSEIEEPARVLAPGRLRYPPGLEAAGLAGRVELQFVVDTAGRVERNSIVVLASSAPPFEVAARGAVLDTRFRPARAHGQHVRQLVRQSLVFVVPER